MTLISLLVFLIIVGAVLYLVSAVIPMPAWIKTVINAIATVAVLLLVLKVFGIWHGQVPRFQ